MNKQKVPKFAKGLKLSLAKHSPEIYGIGIAGMITSTFLAVKATPKALILIEKKKEELNNAYFDRKMDEDGDLRDYDEVTKLKFSDTIKTTWKCYIPAAVTTAVSISCLIGASTVHIKRNAVLATAYQLSETALTEYREKVVETIGEKKKSSYGIRSTKIELRKSCIES